MKENINFAYKVKEMKFPAYSSTVKDNLTKEDADNLCKKLNSKCDVYTEYSVVEYIIPVNEFRDNQINKLIK